MKKNKPTTLGGRIKRFFKRLFILILILILLLLILVFTVGRNEYNKQQEKAAMEQGNISATQSTIIPVANTATPTLQTTNTPSRNVVSFATSQPTNPPTEKPTQLPTMTPTPIITKAATIEPTPTHTPKATEEIVNHTEHPQENEVKDKDAFIDGQALDGNVEAISIANDNLITELMALGFTEEEAIEPRSILLMCGIESIKDYEKTSPTATIDDLVSYRIVYSKEKTAWFTIEKRKLFYVAVNGVDLYDSDKGGFLMNINDVHIPETYVSIETRMELEDRSVTVLRPYFIYGVSFPSIACGRSDDKYMTRCIATAKNGFGVKRDIFCYVWFEKKGDTFTVEAVEIDGVRYQ